MSETTEVPSFEGTATSATLGHNLWPVGEVCPSAPDQIKDRNGVVVLLMCRRCRLAESELVDQKQCPGDTEMSFKRTVPQPRTEMHAATAKLLLQALDICFRHDIRPSEGPLAGQDNLEAREWAACSTVEWALGDRSE